MPATCYGNFATYATRLAYHVRSAYPVSAWLDVLVLTLFYMGSIAVVHRELLPPAPGVSSGSSSSDAREPPWIGPTRSVLGCGLLFWMLLQAPVEALRLLNLCTLPLLVASYATQAILNIRNRSTKSLKTQTVLRRWSRSLARVFTTVAQLGGDLTLLAVHLSSTIGCSVLLLQLWWYGRAANAADVRSPAATTAVDAAAAAPGGATSLSYDYLLAALMWRSLGGFEEEARAEQRAKRPSRENLRAAFARVDTNRTGMIGREELKEAVLRTRPDVPEAVLSKMFTAADQDRDGKVSFDEYLQIMEAD